MTFLIFLLDSIAKLSFVSLQWYPSLRNVLFPRDPEFGLMGIHFIVCLAQPHNTLKNTSHYTVWDTAMSTTTATQIEARKKKLM